MRSWTAFRASAICVLCFSAGAAHLSESKPSHSPVGSQPVQRSSPANNMINDEKLFDDVPFDRDEPAACSPADPAMSQTR